MKPGGFWRFVTYAGVGALGTAAQYVVLCVLVWTGSVLPWTASCIGAVAGAVVNYLLNFHVTFRGHEKHGVAAPKFFCVALISVLANSAIMWALLKLKMPWFIAQCLSTGAVLIMTYTLNSRWTFGRRGVRT